MIVTVSFSDQAIDVKLDLLRLRVGWNVCPTTFAQIHRVPGLPVVPLSPLSCG